jgi:hypothetical protein
MAIGKNQRLSYYQVDCKHAVITQKLEKVSVVVGDFAEGTVTSIEFQDWIHEGETKYAVKICFDGSDMVSFNAQTTFARMVIGRLASEFRYGLVGEYVRITPYMYEDRCCGAVRKAGGIKLTTCVEFPSPIEVRVGGKVILDDSATVELIRQLVADLATVKHDSNEVPY